MAATYTESSEHDFGTGSASYPKPSVATDDYMIIFHDRRSDNASHTLTAPSGWSTAYNQAHFNGIFSGCFYRKVDGGEGAGPYVVGGTTAYGQFGSIGKISGANTTTFLHDSGFGTSTGSTATTGATVDGEDANGIAFFYIATDGATTTGNPAAQFGGTVTQPLSLDGGDSELWVEQGWSAGNTGRTYSISLGTGKNHQWGFVSIKGAAVAAAPLKTLMMMGVGR